ncbi:MAG: exopolysaccharide biosynthesis protein [Pseudobdellovibrio sp.]
MANLLSENFKFLKDEFSQHDLSLQQLLDRMGEKAHAIIIVTLSLPFCTPIPVPGLSTLLGLMISIVIVSWYLRKSIWLPLKMKEYHLSGPLFSKVFGYGERYAIKIEHLLKARGHIFFNTFFARTLLFLLILASAIFLALPLPPGTNFPPALALIALSLSILYEDVYLLLFGILIFLVQAYILTYVVFFLINQALPYIKSFVF